jgi:hypothetical protein
MAKALALAIGLNAVDPKHYGGWSGRLLACEADAKDMAAIAKAKKYPVKTLLTKAATRAAVKAEIAKAALLLKAGDLFVLSYSGHGGQIPDLNGDEVDDNQDETWCLYDGELVDDELYSALQDFAAGVRILIFSDSCHSGTVAKQAFYHGTAATRGRPLETEEVRYRAMPPEVALRTYRDNRKFYDAILKDESIKNSLADVKASVLLISGCQDNQLSHDGTFNGLFTGQMLRVWNNGAFTGNYGLFHKQIKLRMPPDQTPNLFRAGAADPAFEAGSPFGI